MKITCYETDAKELREQLLYLELTDEDKINALISLCAIVDFLQAEIEKLKEKTK